MIQKEKYYRVTLIDCNGKDLEIAKFLQIMTGMEKTETRRIVANLPCVLYDALDGEACSYIEETFDFYMAKYKFESIENENSSSGYVHDSSVYPSRQVLVLGSMVDYIGKRTEFVNLARKYDFNKSVKLNDTPFLVKDGMESNQADRLKQDLRNMGMSALVMRSAAEIQQIKKRSLFADIFSKK